MVYFSALLNQIITVWTFCEQQWQVWEVFVAQLQWLSGKFHEVREVMHQFLCQQSIAVCNHAARPGYYSQQLVATLMFEHQFRVVCERFVFVLSLQRVRWTNEGLGIMYETHGTTLKKTFTYFRFDQDYIIYKKCKAL